MYALNQAETRCLNNCQVGLQNENYYTQDSTIEAAIGYLS